MQRPLFLACRGVVKKHTATALFLLPYLLQNVLAFGGEEDKQVRSCCCCNSKWHHGGLCSLKCSTPARHPP